MPQPRRLVLVVHPDVQVHDQCTRVFQRRGCEVRCFSGSTHVEQLFRTAKPDLILTGIRMADKDGFEVLRRALSVDPSLPVIAVTTHPSVAGAVRFVQAGGADYLAVPFTVDQLIEATERVIKRAGSRVCRSPHIMASPDPLGSILGVTRCVQEMKSIVMRAAGSDVSVLIRGETGTGKELVAQAIHQLSTRASGPFLPVDCASLPPTLLESELFGYQRGAFTGADRSRCGLFESAHGGTMFLDEIGELEASTQPRLFRVLQEGKIRQIGGRRDTPVDVRVLAATNRNLEQGIRDGTFRLELYFRLKAVTISVPPLRERKKDIPLLSTHFLAIFKQMHGRYDISGIDPSFIDALTDYSWPGNVRELKNAVEQAVVLAEGPILTRADLAQEPMIEETRAPDYTPTEVEDELPDYLEERDRILDEFDRRYFARLLSLYRGNLSEAARKSGIGRKTLYNKLRRTGILPFESVGPL